MAMGLLCSCGCGTDLKVGIYVADSNIMLYLEDHLADQSAVETHAMECNDANCTGTC